MNWTPDVPGRLVRPVPRYRLRVITFTSPPACAAGAMTAQTARTTLNSSIVRRPPRELDLNIGDPSWLAQRPPRPETPSQNWSCSVNEGFAPPVRRAERPLLTQPSQNAQSI